VRGPLETRLLSLVFPVILPLSLALLMVFTQACPVSATETGDVALSLYTLGVFPSKHGLFAQGSNPSDAGITNRVGAGIKIAVFPRNFGNSIGIELESFGHGSEITFSSTTRSEVRHNEHPRR